MRSVGGRTPGSEPPGRANFTPWSGGYRKTRVRKPTGLSMRNRSQGWYLNSAQRRKDSFLGAQSPVYEARSRSSAFDSQFSPIALFIASLNSSTSIGSMSRRVDSFRMVDSEGLTWPLSTVLTVLSDRPATSASPLMEYNLRILISLRRTALTPLAPMMPEGAPRSQLGERDYRFSF